MGSQLDYQRFQQRIADLERRLDREHEKLELERSAHSETLRQLAEMGVQHNCDVENCLHAVQQTLEVGKQRELWRQKAAESEAACGAMRAALKPFAAVLDQYTPEEVKNRELYKWSGWCLTQGHLERARDALAYDVGRGWHSPEEWKQQNMTIGNLRLQVEDAQGQLVGMRRALEELVNANPTDLPSYVALVVRTGAAALASDHEDALRQIEWESEHDE